jgi:hypothetical protein
MAQSVVENRYSAFKASHDVSKSHTMSRLALWRIEVHLRPGDHRRGRRRTKSIFDAVDALAPTSTLALSPSAILMTLPPTS